jgi:hypothetical protein
MPRTAEAAGGVTVASIRIVNVPDGQAPEYIRRAWVGLVLPLPAGHPPGPRAVCTQGVLSRRWRRWLPVFLPQGRIDEVFLVAGSAAIDVLKKSDPYAAEWWIKNTPHLLQPGRALGFQPQVCKLLD